MSSLSSQSTLAEIQAAYDDNASYAEDSNLGKARAFATACRLLLRRTPLRLQKGGGGGEEIEIDTKLVQGELNRVQDWIDACAAASTQVTFADFRGFR